MASELLWSLPHPNEGVSPPMDIPERRPFPSTNRDDMLSIFDANETGASLPRFDTLNSPSAPFLDDDASDAFHMTPARPPPPFVPSGYTNYGGQVKCIDWAYEAKLHPPVPVVPVSPSSRLARVTRARHREHKMAQNGIRIPSTDDDPRKHKGKVSFPFSLKKLVKQVKRVHESPSRPITPEQPSSSISTRTRTTVSLPESLKDASFVQSPSSPKTPTRSRRGHGHSHGHSRTRSRHLISPRLFLLKNEQIGFGASMQEKMEPLLPVVEAIYSDQQLHRPSLTSRLSSKRKREDEGGAGLESPRPASRLRVEL